jgi:hypothetical protein
MTHTGRLQTCDEWRCHVRVSPSPLSECPRGRCALWVGPRFLVAAQEASGVLRDWRGRASREVCWSGESWVSGTTGLVPAAPFASLQARDRRWYGRLCPSLGSSSRCPRPTRCGERFGLPLDTRERACRLPVVDPFAAGPGDVRPWPFATLAPRAAMRDARRSILEAPGRAGAGMLPE